MQNLPYKSYQMSIFKKRGNVLLCNHTEGYQCFSVIICSVIGFDWRPKW